MSLKQLKTVQENVIMLFSTRVTSISDETIIRARSIYRMSPGFGLLPLIHTIEDEYGNSYEKDWRLSEPQEKKR